jgi:hypothetical protein
MSITEKYSSCREIADRIKAEKAILSRQKRASAKQDENIEKTLEILAQLEDDFIEFANRGETKKLGEGK